MELFIGFGLMGLVALFYREKLSTQEQYLLEKMGTHLLNSGWDKMDIMLEIDSYRLHTLDLTGRTEGQYRRALADHLEVADQNYFSLNSKEKEKLVARLRRSIEIIAFMKGWETNELTSLSERILLLLEENEEGRKRVLDTRAKAAYQALVDQGKLSKP